MANTPARRSGTNANRFAWFMLAMVVFVVLLLWYFQARQGSLPTPAPRAGVMHAA